MQVVKTFKHKAVDVFKFGYGLFGKPQMYVHCFWVDGLLIDTGQSNARKSVLTALRDKTIEQIFITHHHEDHTGNLHVLQKQLQCPAYAHPLCVELMKNPPSISFAQWITWGRRPANFKIQPSKHQIQTSNYTFEIIPIPGHSTDHTCLYERNQGWLFSADLYANDFIRYFMKGESMYQQIQSIHKILKLDFDTLFCSHNPQLENAKERLRAKVQFFEDFYGRVLMYYNRGITDAELILQELAKQGLVDLRKDKVSRLVSGGKLSTLNMVEAVLNDEQLIRHKKSFGESN